ncbi:MAG TPA: maleylpyruvate isomerase N-terminal domain-containing protein [Motilibacteraceae bacterium]|nr:maleylpyruvate isomerase N-terminal domain-containing protein [Motilibacteraceae bacterium]
MPSAPRPLVPDAGERGLSSADLGAVAGSLLAAWDGFLVVAQHLADAGGLSRPSRLPGWSARDVCVHLGSWPDAPVLERLLADGRAAADGGLDGAELGAPLDVDGANEAVLAAHRDASDDEVMAALRAARERTVDFLDSPEARGLALAPTRTLLGPLPLLGHVGAAAYELAVHALDLGPAAAPAPSDDLLLAGLGALADVTGALCARSGVSATVAILTPLGGWAFGSRGPDWTTVQLGPDAAASTLGWPSLEGAAPVVLDASAGRAAVPPLLLRRELRVHDVPGLLALVPVLDAVPGLPGGAALAAGARYLSGLTRFVRRLPGLH